MTATGLTLTAAAKINLSLYIRGRRADGYHELESLVAFADTGDRLTLTPAHETSLRLIGPFGEALAGDDNLILKAHKLLAAHCGMDMTCAITLEKNLPIASGLGGGSADAAATLRGLIALFEPDMSASSLSGLACELGADVPVCLAHAPAWMSGIGQEVTRLAPLPETDIVLVNPLIAMPTGPVFQALNAGSDLTPSQPHPPQFADLGTLITYLKTQGNALTAPAVKLSPVIQDCLQTLAQAGGLYAAMSGSGASCFALAEPGQAAALAARYQASRPDDWVVAARLIGAGDTKIDKA